MRRARPAVRGCRPRAGYDRVLSIARPRRSRKSREDPRSRREVAARRPGPAGPRLGGRANADGRAGGRREVPGRSLQRHRQGRHQGPGPRGRARQGGRRQARLDAGRGGGRGRPDPRPRDQGPAGPPRARRSSRRDRQGVLPVGASRPGDQAPDVHRLVRGRRRDRAGRRRQPGGDRLPARGPAAGPAGPRGPRAGVQDRLRRPLEGGRGHRQGPPADDARQRRGPRWRSTRWR